MIRKQQKQRIWELDFIRGFAIIMMVFDHIMYDLSTLPNYFSNFFSLEEPVFGWLNDAAIWYWNSTLRFFGWYFFVLMFLLVSGISFTFSKNNFRRGFKMVLVAILISVVTFIMDQFFVSGVLIIFGVIHMFAINTLITAGIRHFIKNEMVILFIGMAILTISVIFGFFSPDYVGLSWSSLPSIIIGSKAFGADHFGILPYLGIILIGTVIGKTFYQHRMSLLPGKALKSNNIVLITGRYSLWVYVLHQPLVLGLVLGIAYIFGYRF